ncbi:MAG: decaprenyl-phosphate phosphoribosyltransferase [Gemmatimonadales bacterium]
MSSTATSAGLAGRAASPADYIRLLRPRQWIKNGFVLAPLLFSGLGVSTAAFVNAAVAFIMFCMVASSVYAWNDVYDRVSDQAHPIKRNRPVASGRISVRAAIGLGAALCLAAVALGLALHPPLLAVVLTYLGLNMLYTFRLKHMVILDVFSIAAFFILRLLAGTVAIEVEASIWLLTCGGLLALYLGFAKRRHELLLLGDDSAAHRTVLAEYSPHFLDQMSSVLLSVTVVSYILYTVSEEKVAELGYLLSYSTIFVLYGVFRYLYLVHQRAQGSPTETLLTDRSLIVAVGLWILYCFWVVYRPF